MKHFESLALGATFDAYVDANNTVYAEDDSAWEAERLGRVYQGTVNSILADNFPRNYEEIENGWNLLRSDFVISTLADADDYIEKPYHYGRDVLVAILHTIEDAMGLDQEDYTQ